MEELYKELLSRMKYLKSEHQTEDILIRINECSLVICRIQQLLLADITL